LKVTTKKTRKATKQSGREKKKNVCLRCNGENQIEMLTPNNRGNGKKQTKRGEGGKSGNTMSEKKKDT